MNRLEIKKKKAKKENIRKNKDTIFKFVKDYSETPKSTAGPSSVNSLYASATQNQGKDEVQIPDTVEFLGRVTLNLSASRISDVIAEIVTPVQISANQQDQTFLKTIYENDFNMQLLLIPKSFITLIQISPKSQQYHKQFNQRQTQTSIHRKYYQGNG
ncbi:hypothetical protein NPIL_500841 [Nephila pilipes]|uniref:Uncharacterized protein n=1 Tax=Nephila pilipes TaxID=299642 RepID=A0A8X6MB74_NEPPI|nr:hypothetical protein NPIL_500841 [Nephila pilipes]